MDEINKPLLVEKGRREREMVTVDLSSQGSTTTMHEGYEGQKKYLVPDTDLLAMKKLLELKGGGKPVSPGYTGSPHYKKPKYSIDDDDISTEGDLYSLNRKPVEDPKEGEKQDRPTRVMFDKSTFEYGTDSLENKDAMSSKDVQEPKDNILKDESRDDSKLGSDKRSKTETSIKTDEFDVTPDVDPVSTHKDSESKRFSTPIENSYRPSSKFESTNSNLPYKSEIGKGNEVFEPYSNNFKPRILLSGHLKKDLKPIFIVHKYYGESLFGEKSPDFMNSKIESEVELIMSGKFYKHSILEELNGYPKSLLVNKRRIPIDDGCKVFEDSVYQMLCIGDIEVELEAKFIKAVHLRAYTPFLTLKVHRLTSLEPNSISGSNGSIIKPLITLERHLTYYVQKPESKNVFKPDAQNQKEEELEQDSRGFINPCITLDRQLAYNFQNLGTKNTFDIDSLKQKSWRKSKDSYIKNVPSSVLRNFKNYETTVNYQTAIDLDSKQDSEHENNLEINQTGEQIYCDACLKEIRGEKWESCEGKGEDKQKCLNTSETDSNVDQQSKAGSSINEQIRNVEKSDFDYLRRSKGEKRVTTSDSQADISPKYSVESLRCSSSLQPAKVEQVDCRKYFPVREYRCEVRNKKKKSLIQTFCRYFGRGKLSAQKKTKTVNPEIRKDCEEDTEVNQPLEYRCIVRPKKSRSQNHSSLLNKNK